MKILKNIGLLVGSIVLALLFGYYFGAIYFRFFPYYGGFFSFGPSFDQFLIGLPAAYLSFLFFLFTAFGDHHKYYWAGIAAIPVILLLIDADTTYLFIHIPFPIIGWLIGWGINKLIYW